MGMSEVLTKIRQDLREHPAMRFSELYFSIRLRSVEATSTEIHNALCLLLKNDEVRVENGQWHLSAPTERRRAS
jgi:hypothetical protein